MVPARADRVCPSTDLSTITQPVIPIGSLRKAMNVGRVYAVVFLEVPSNRARMRALRGLAVDSQDRERGNREF